MKPPIVARPFSKALGAGDGKVTIIEEYDLPES